MTQTLSIKDVRNNLADVINQVGVAGNTIVITKFGKPRAMLVPISDKKTLVGKFDETFGAWKERKDIKDSGKWVRNLRKKISLRQKI